MQCLFGRPKRRMAFSVHRNEKGDDNPRERRLKPGFHHRKPKHRPDRHISGGMAYPCAIEQSQTAHRRRGDQDRRQRKMLAVENSDDNNRTDVVEYRQGGKEDLQAHGHSRAEKRKDAQSKDDIRCRRYGPAFDRRRIANIQTHINYRGNQHTAKRGYCRQRCAFRCREMAFDHLSFDFESDKDEEYDHEALIDPMNESPLEYQAADPNMNWRMVYRLIKTGQWRICRNQGERHGNKHDDAGGLLEREKFSDLHVGDWSVLGWVVSMPSGERVATCYEISITLILRRRSRPSLMMVNSISVPIPNASNAFANSEMLRTGRPSTWVMMSPIRPFL